MAEAQLSQTSWLKAEGTQSRAAFGSELSDWAAAAPHTEAPPPCVAHSHTPWPPVFVLPERTSAEERRHLSLPLAVYLAGRCHRCCSRENVLLTLRPPPSEGPSARTWDYCPAGHQLYTLNAAEGRESNLSQISEQWASAVRPGKRRPAAGSQKNPGSGEFWSLELPWKPCTACRGRQIWGTHGSVYADLHRVLIQPGCDVTEPPTFSRT